MPTHLPRSRSDPAAVAAGLYPDEPAILLPGGRDEAAWSFAELDRRVETLADALFRQGVAPGTRVAMQLPPSPEAVILLLASWRVGAVCVPMHHRWTSREIERGLRAAGNPAVFVSNEDPLLDVARASPARAALPDLRTRDGREDGRPEAANAGARELSDPAVLILTSGSAGSPRPVLLSHGHLAASARAASERLDLSPTDRWLAVLSPAHVGGLALIHRAIFLGSSIAPLRGFEGADAAKLIEHAGITHVSLVPVLFRKLLDHRGGLPAPGALRCVLLGGAATPADLLDRALRLGYPVALTYGLTEATSQVATAEPTRVRAKPGTVGPPLRGVDLRINAPGGKGGGQLPKQSKVGEILVRGPTVAGALPGNGPSLDEEGWLHTGDLGHLDADGDLWITGRLSDRIVSGGVTVDPGEVEEALREHPAVAAAVVAGIPDSEWGERLVALIVAVETEAPPDRAQLLEHVRARLSAAKRPRTIHIVEELPLNANGKVDRSRVAAILRRSSA